MYSENIQNFFQKVRQWQSKKQENNLLQKIEKKDIRLNKSLYTYWMATLHEIDKIWE